jgi:hypothetical protein
MPRVFRMAGRREMPQFFDIDDTVPDRAPHHPAPGNRPSPDQIEEDRS